MAKSTTLPYSTIKNKLVHVVDRDPVTCETVMLLMKLEGFEVAFSLTTEDFFFAAKERAPDVAVINFLVDERSGLSVLTECRRLNPSAVVIMLADVENTEQTVAAMRCGANHVMSKPMDHERLSRLIREAIKEDIRVTYQENGQTKVDVLGFANLTDRERQVLELIVNGDSNKVAAMKLGISHRTLEVHRAKCMSKLRAKNLADLMRLVMSSQYIRAAS